MKTQTSPQSKIKDMKMIMIKLCNVISYVKSRKKSILDGRFKINGRGRGPRFLTHLPWDLVVLDSNPPANQCFASTVDIYKVSNF